jgi:hypothetical protein
VISKNIVEAYSQVVELNLENNHSGIYFVNVEYNGVRKVFKIIKN